MNLTPLSSDLGKRKELILTNDDYESYLTERGVGCPYASGSFKRACKILSNPNQVALLSSPDKIKSHFFQQQAMEIAEQEDRILTLLQGGPHIPFLHESCFFPQKRYALIVQKVGPDLFESYLNRSHPNIQPLTIHDIERIAKQALEAIAYMHAQKIGHFDIKETNLSRDGFVFDFGLSKKVENGSIDDAKSGTAQYWAPEIILKDRKFLVTDLWALGVTLWNLITKDTFAPLRRGDDHAQRDINLLHIYQQRMGLEIVYCQETAHFFQAASAPESIPKLKPSTLPPVKHFKNGLNSPPELVDLITQMLEPVWEERITAEKALLHPFFKGAQSTDRSFYINFSFGGDLSESELNVIDENQQIVMKAPLVYWRPNQCYHLRKSEKPYTFQVVNQFKTVLYQGAHKIEEDGQTLHLSLREVNPFRRFFN